VSIAGSGVTFFAALPIEDAEEAREVAERAGWKFDERLSRATPPNYQIVALKQDLDQAADLSRIGSTLVDQLQEQGVQPAAVAAQDRESSSIRMGSAKPTSQWEVNLLPSTIGPGILSKIIDGVYPAPSAAPASAASGPAADAARKDDSGSAPKSPSPTAAPSPPVAATISAVVPALADPAIVWDKIKADKQGKIAEELIEGVYAERGKLAASGEWAVSPELSLLRLVDDDRRKDLAEELLRVRGEITGPDADVRKAHAALEQRQADLAAKDIELADSRVALAGVGVDLAREALEQMRKWRSIADVGLWVLGATTAFSMLATAYILLKLMPDDQVSDVAAPIMIFVLALFAISPAVLLLRERPLEGIDKWSPAGPAEGKGEEEEGEAASGSGSKGGSEAATTATSS
jgi:hypothetical protein